jgi:hypothetical protein
VEFPCAAGNRGTGTVPLRRAAMLTAALGAVFGVLTLVCLVAAIETPRSEGG